MEYAREGFLAILLTFYRGEVSKMAGVWVYRLMAQLRMIFFCRVVCDLVMVRRYIPRAMGLRFMVLVLMPVVAFAWVE